MQRSTTESPGAVQIVDNRVLVRTVCVSLAIVKLGTGSSAIRFAPNLFYKSWRKGESCVPSQRHSLICGLFEGPRASSKRCP